MLTFMLETTLAYLTQILSLKTIKGGLSLLIAWFSYMIWWIDMAVKAFLFLVLIDFILGFTIACWQGKFSKKRMMQGLVKFILYGIAMIVGNQIDMLIFHTSVEFWAKNLIVLYIWINDGISILKHLSTLWLNIPRKLIDRLQQFQDSLDIDTSKW